MRHKSLTFPPLSTARYSFKQLSQLGRQWRERKCPIFEMVPKGDSNQGSLDCESGVLPLGYRAPHAPPPAPLLVPPATNAHHPAPSPPDCCSYCCTSPAPPPPALLLLLPLLLILLIIAPHAPHPAHSAPRLTPNCS